MQLEAKSARARRSGGSLMWRLCLSIRPRPAPSCTPTTSSPSAWCACRLHVQPHARVVQSTFNLARSRARCLRLRLDGSVHGALSPYSASRTRRLHLQPRAHAVSIFDLMYHRLRLRTCRLRLRAHRLRFCIRRLRPLPCGHAWNIFYVYCLCFPPLLSASHVHTFMLFPSCSPHVHIVSAIRVSTSHPYRPYHPRLVPIPSRSCVILSHPPSYA